MRQHVQTFQRRFAGLSIEVAHLSRLVKPAEAKAVKQGRNRRQIDENVVLNLAARRPDLLTGIDPATGAPKPFGAVYVAIGAVTILGMITVFVILAIWAERRFIARLQDRLGPNRVGTFGLLP